MNLTLFFSLGLIHWIALMSPGPDFALIVRHSQHRHAAMAAAVGISLGILAHCILSLTGVSLLIQNHAILFALVRTAGASYLLWLGIKSLAACLRPSSHPSAHTMAIGSRRIGLAVRDGLATNLLNPKALVFFVGLLAALVTPEVSLGDRVILIIEFFLLALLWFVPLAWLLSSHRVRACLSRAERSINLVTGVIFSGVGGAILLALLRPLLAS